MAEIFIIQPDGTLVPMHQRDYESENLLQKLLADYPALLAGDQVDPGSPRHWLLVQREFPVPDSDTAGSRWSLDHLFLDQEGVPTLVEVKRAADTRIRREVVGQMLDYAANAVKYWPVEEIRRTFEESLASTERDPDDAIRDLTGDDDPENFWHAVKTNLQAGRVRMLFVADSIPDELRRIVEFLNEQMDPAEVLAIEIKQFANDSLTTLVPRVIGQTAEAESRKQNASGSRIKRRWNESDFFAEATARHGESVASVARRLYDFAREHFTRIAWGGGGTNGSFRPVLEHAGADHYPFTVYLGGREGQQATVETNFFWHARKRPFNDRNKRLELLRQLNAIPGVNLDPSAVDRRPPIPLKLLEDPRKLEGFLRAMDWYAQQVKSSTATTSDS